MRGDWPTWEPLFDAVGEEVASRFMWMFEVDLEDGNVLHAYKHKDTRRSIHLDRHGAAFVYIDPDRYRRMPAADILEMVFASLPGLFGVTPEEIAAADAAVDRLRAGEEAAA